MERIIRFLLEELTRVPWHCLRLLIHAYFPASSSTQFGIMSSEPKGTNAARASTRVRPGSGGRGCQEQRRRLPGREAASKLRVSQVEGIAPDRVSLGGSSWRGGAFFKPFLRDYFDEEAGTGHWLPKSPQPSPPPTEPVALRFERP